jgi:hypothetical protein
MWTRFIEARVAQLVTSLQMPLPTRFLFLAILIDSFTITMMKVAQDEGSVGKLVISYFGYFLR